MSLHTRVKINLLALVLLLPMSCSFEKEPFYQTEAFQRPLEEAMKNYASLVHANYQDALADAQQLQKSLAMLVSEPSEKHLEAAKKAWLQSRESYGQTEAFRFYGGPIDGEEGLEGRLNAWPLDESYIDYVEVDANGEGDAVGTNIINATEQFPEITAELIASMNEKGAETNISSGYHAIEFLLWGQDTSEGPGGGNRPYTDYLIDGSGTHANQQRRGAYLLAASNLLVEDLQQLVEEWSEEGSYCREFTQRKNLMVSLKKLLEGLGKLSKGELAGERIFVAWDLRNKEDEHSCFSDNTHRDIVANAKGIMNVYTGNYPSSHGNSVTGMGIKDLVEMGNPELANRLEEAIKTSLKAAEAIQPPFDQEILQEAGRERVKAVFMSLRKQGDLFSEAAALFEKKEVASN